MKSVALAALGYAVSIVSAGCTFSRATTEAFVVRDSAGIRILESAAPRDPAHWIVDSIPEVEIRSDFGEPEHFLYNVFYMTVLSDGHLVVGNSGTNQLFWFDDGGALKGVRGGRGEGPGELQAVFGLFRCGDDRVVVEERTRLSVFDASGMFLRTVPIVGHLAEGRADVAGIAPNCDAAVLVDRSYQGPPATTEISTVTFPSYWVAFDDGARSATVSISASDFRRWSRDGVAVRVRMPYGREAVWATRGDVFLVGLAKAFEFRAFDRTGSLREIVRWHAEAEPVTTDDWNHYTSALATYFRENPEERAFEPPAELFQAPAAKPAYSRLLVDDEARTWVQRYGRYGAHGVEPSTDWWVFDATGRWVAAVSMPSDLAVLAVAGNRVFGVFRDELDAEHVRVHRIRK